MFAAILAILTAILGVAVGGLVRAWEARSARKKEAAALLSALVSEVEAISRLVNHRRFPEAIASLAAQAQAMIDEGRGDEPAPWMAIEVRQNYFSVFDASVGKIGLLHPFFADRITRFYTYAKASLENYHPESPHQGEASAHHRLLSATNDAQLIGVMMALGGFIAGFRDVTPPKGLKNPFANLDQQELNAPVVPAYQAPFDETSD